MQTKKSKRSFIKIGLVIALIAIISTTIVYATIMVNVQIPSSGIISTSEIIANSGSITDIQAAVNAVSAAGGGTVHIPAGNFTFNPPAMGVGVTIPPGVNLVGAGKNSTFLIETVESKESTMIKVDGMITPYNTPNLQNVQKSVKIVGVSFIGFVPSRSDADTTTNNVGLSINCVKDFLVYDCFFSNFVNCGVSTMNNMGWVVSAYINRGVISHCTFDNPYKNDLNISGRIWGYGIIVGGTGYWAGTAPVRSLLGRYDDVNNVVYIEDNAFYRCRHAIASSQAGYYVARYNYFTDMVQCFYTSFVDVHGSGKGFEIYNNTIMDVPADIRITSMLSPIETYLGRYMGRGIGIRGGSGVIFNNSIINCGTNGIGLTNDGGLVPDASLNETRTQDVFVWGNIFQNVPNQITTDGSVILNTDYFLRQPHLAQDGFTYTPYPYPHPLTLQPSL
jgi:hypothetical protein